MENRNFLSIPVVFSIIELFKKSMLFYIIPLPVCFYIGYNFSVLIGSVLAITFFCLATLIGINEIIIEALKTICMARERINEAHYNQIVVDTEKLKKVYEYLGAENNDMAREKLYEVLTGNIDIINAIKTAMNGAPK